MQSKKASALRRTLRLAVSASLVAVAALAFSGNAQAHGKHKGHRHAPVVIVPAPVRPAFVVRPVMVPGRIVVQSAPAYAPYRYGTVWAPEHRHHHVLYRFPVATPFGVGVQSHAYCDGYRVLAPAVPVTRDGGPHGFVSFGDEHVRFGFGF